MKLELKESNSPFWLIGLSKGNKTPGTFTNVTCYYKSGKKQYDRALKIAQEPNVDEVYLITGIEWDNMKGSWSAKEAGAYIQNKGKLIWSKNEITKYMEKYGNDNKLIEDKYPKGISRDPLPKRGAKIYTSPVANLENKGDDKKMKLELKDENATKQKYNVGDTFNNAGTTWKVLKQNNDDTLLVALDNEGNEKSRYVVAWGLDKDNTWGQGHYFQGRDEAEKYFNQREYKMNESKDTDNLPDSVVLNMLRAISNGDLGKAREIGEKALEDKKEVKNESKSSDKWTVQIKKNDIIIDAIAVEPKDSENYLNDIIKELNNRYNKKNKLKESKIVAPVGNPQTAGSFVNIDVDLDHLEVSDFITRLAQAVRSEQLAITEYVALRSANGITNEERALIDNIIEEEKNHMVAITTCLYKQILVNHSENVDKANSEFVLPKFGMEIFDNSNEGKLTESIQTVISTICDSHTKLYEELFNDKADFIKELKTDTNYDEIAYHIHEYSKIDKEHALKLMDMLFELEKNKSPKECRDEIIKSLELTENKGIRMSDDYNVNGEKYHGLGKALDKIKNIISTSNTKVTAQNLTITEDVKFSFAGETMSQTQYDIEVDVDYDADFQGKVANNIVNAIHEMNPITYSNDKYAIAEDKGKTKLGDTLTFELLIYKGFNKEINEDFIESITKKLLDKASTYEYYIQVK